MEDLIEPKFKPGDKVKFRPKVAKYAANEYIFKGHVGEVMDKSDLPNVLFNKISNTYGNILTAHQDDLRLVRR